MPDVQGLENTQQWTYIHYKTILVAGVGFFLDAYDLFIINLAMPMISYVYFEGQIPSSLDSAIKGAATFGTLIGQLTFGYLADKLGRKRIYGTELMIIFIATVGSALSANFARGSGIAGLLFVWRLILGFGIGGDYPLSATITSEFANKHNRGMMIAIVFANQGTGILIAALVAVMSLASYSARIRTDLLYLDDVWRICLGFGAIPALATIYFRLTMPESPRYAAHVAQNTECGTSSLHETSQPLHKSIRQSEDAESEDEDIFDAANTLNDTLSSSQPFLEYFRQWRNLKVLLGCCLTWFCLDVAFYGIQLNQSIVLQAIGYGTGKEPFDDLWHRAIGNLVISLLGTVPGYWASVFLIEKLGRKTIQLIGFAALAVCLFILSIGYNVILSLSTGLFVVIYTIAQFFFNFGPNTTTFVLPSEVFPTQFRAQAHGISAASGKLGAILGAFLFGPLKDIGGHNAALPSLLFVFALFMCMGFIFTLWLPETAGKTLEDITLDRDQGNREDSLMEIWNLFRDKVYLSRHPANDAIQLHSAAEF
ncbi:hypothetical protein SmJEL517_g05007 [Synchytrium microbalum]|uniref:Major facilitator superfamily (MFS) profile domain-containing protein n=1 Tax=Synchytrium microbalum TaxID=1806994 RepID=A0A507C172_9FUNG|nr:uncharacterized protein SmJEL517_g05007 [Synchytrium microbalum]TPX31736.1 hypothetical protein SmJEL517_g05007 [Synchytrium microbalum]